MSPRAVQFIAIALGAALLLATARFTPGINANRAALETQGAFASQVNIPPEYAFAVQALGAFRGLITNIAFMRAEQYKNQGRHFDAMQLANWICMLQPHFPSVWEFQAWNMAWNISVTTWTPEERWNWVYNGVKLLRDYGIKFNRNSTNLYKQLAWIYVNKMSETVDEHHMTYKRNWAYRMHLVLGPPPDPFGDYRPGERVKQSELQIGEDAMTQALQVEAQRRREKRALEGTLRPWEKALDADGDGRPDAAETNPDLEAPMSEDYYIVMGAFRDAMMQIANAPDRLADLYSQQPDARAMVTALREINAVVDDQELDEERYWSQSDGLAWTFLYRYRVLTDPPSMLSQVLQDETPDPDAASIERFDQIVGVRKGDPAGAALVKFVQKKVLRDVYELDPKKMADLIALFGPIDFRLVDAHSLYWLNEGLVRSQQTINDFGNDKTNTARLVFFSLHNLYLRNRLDFEPSGREINKAYINFNPDLYFIEPMHRAFLSYAKGIDPDPEQKGVGGTFRSGHVNFLAEAIRLLYFAGRIEDASHYYNYLRREYDTTSQGQRNTAFDKPLRDYVFDSFREDYSQADVRNALFGVLMSAFSNLADSNLAQYDALYYVAYDLHRNYNQGRDLVFNEKLRLPPFEQCTADVLRQWFLAVPRSGFDTVRKVRLWNSLPLPLKHAVYDDLREIFALECERVGFELSRCFPEPELMDNYRKTAPKREVAPPPDSVETPAQTPS